MDWGEEMHWCDAQVRTLAVSIRQLGSEESIDVLLGNIINEDAETSTIELDFRTKKDAQEFSAALIQQVMSLGRELLGRKMKCSATVRDRLDFHVPVVTPAFFSAAL
jgi:hypothetical protein